MPGRRPPCDLPDTCLVGVLRNQLLAWPGQRGSIISLAQALQIEGLALHPRAWDANHFNKREDSAERKSDSIAARLARHRVAGVSYSRRSLEAYVQVQRPPRMNRRTGRRARSVDRQRTLLQPMGLPVEPDDPWILVPIFSSHRVCLSFHEVLSPPTPYVLTCILI